MNSTSPFLVSGEPFLRSISEVGFALVATFVLLDQLSVCVQVCVSFG